MMKLIYTLVDGSELEEARLAAGIAEAVSGDAS
jgi:hypothetical protein